MEQSVDKRRVSNEVTGKNTFLRRKADAFEIRLRRHIRTAFPSGDENMKRRLDDVIDFIAYRSIDSFLKCQAQGSADIKFKAVTIANIVKKIFNNIPIDAKVDFTPWLFKDTVVKVDFQGIKYKYVCPCQCDSNLFLNPYYHEYDIPLLFSTILEKGDSVIDVGAHCGLYTLLAGKITGSQGQIIAIEPNPRNIDLLSLNLKLNKLNNVHIIPKAASDQKSILEIYYENCKTAFTSASKRGSSAVLVETTTLDEIAESLESIKLVKIDTEGYDIKVLRGAIETLPKTILLVVEQTDSDVRHLLSKLGFRFGVLTASRNLLAINKRAQVKRTLEKLNLGMQLA